MSGMEYERFERVKWELTIILSPEAYLKWEQGTLLDKSIAMKDALYFMAHQGSSVNIRDISEEVNFCGSRVLKGESFSWYLQDC